MMLFVQRLQPCLGNMRVNLRGGKIGVAEQHLHHAQIGAVVQQMRGEGVAQGVYPLEWAGGAGAEALGYPD